MPEPSAEPLADAQILAAPWRVAMRLLLRAWARSGRKSERLFGAIERWGPRLARAPLLTRLPDGQRLRCELGEFVQRQIYFQGLHEPYESFLFSRLLRPAMVVLDVGAHVGQYTLLAAGAVGPAGRVHSFEPVPANFARLREHVALNNLANVELVNAALWDAETTVALEASAAGNAGSFTVARAPAGDSVVARAMPLDRYAAERGLARVDLIKMDIEGAEPFALAGGRELIAACHPILLMEVNRPALLKLGSSPAQLWRMLQDFGYRGMRVGYSPARCVALTDLENIEVANCFFHVEDLPQRLTSGWSRRQPKRWACSGW